MNCTDDTGEAGTGAIADAKATAGGGGGGIPGWLNGSGIGVEIIKSGKAFWFGCK